MRDEFEANCKAFFCCCCFHIKIPVANRTGKTSTDFNNKIVTLKCGSSQIGKRIVYLIKQAVNKEVADNAPVTLLLRLVNEARHIS